MFIACLMCLVGVLAGVLSTKIWDRLHRKPQSPDLKFRMSMPLTKHLVNRLGSYMTFGVHMAETMVVSSGCDQPYELMTDEEKEVAAQFWDNLKALSQESDHCRYEDDDSGEDRLTADQLQEIRDSVQLRG